MAFWDPIAYNAIVAHDFLSPWYLHRHGVQASLDVACDLRRCVPRSSCIGVACESAAQITLTMRSNDYRGGFAPAPNQRVEMNRHQPPCLPGRFDSMIAVVHFNVHGQVAVTHPGRWAKSLPIIASRTRPRLVTVSCHDHQGWVIARSRKRHARTRPVVRWLLHARA